MKIFITSVILFISLTLQAQKSEVSVSPKNLKSWGSITVKSEFTGKHKLIIYDQENKKVFEKKLTLEKDIPLGFKHNFKPLKLGTYQIKLIHKRESLVSKELTKKDN